MKLVSPEELRFGHKGLLANLQAALIMRLARLHGINRLYSDSLTRATAVTAEPTNEPAGNRDSKIPGNAFAAAALDVLRIRYEADPGERQHIPAGGGAILIANHPTGALDGILLIDLLTRIRPDIKFMGNFLLDRIEPLKHYFINVDPFDRKQRNNTGGMRQALAHLQNGGLLVIFPAGEVSTWQHGLHGCKDKPWPPSILRFIRKAAVPGHPALHPCPQQQAFPSRRQNTSIVAYGSAAQRTAEQTRPDDPAADRFARSFPTKQTNFRPKHTVVSCGRTSNT